MWGLTRVLPQWDLKKLIPLPFLTTAADLLSSALPSPAPQTADRVWEYYVSAENRRIIYNKRLNIQDPLGMIYRVIKYKAPGGTWVTVPDWISGHEQPMVIRANAGDWIKVTLFNNLDPAKLRYETSKPEMTIDVSFEPAVSSFVGIMPFLADYNVMSDFGGNIGVNGNQGVDM